MAIGRQILETASAGTPILRGVGKALEKGIAAGPNPPRRSWMRFGGLRKSAGYVGTETSRLSLRSKVLPAGRDSYVDALLVEVGAYAILLYAAAIEFMSSRYASSFWVCVVASLALVESDALAVFDVLALLDEEALWFGDSHGGGGGGAEEACDKLDVEDVDEVAEVALVAPPAERRSARNVPMSFVNSLSSLCVTDADEALAEDAEELELVVDVAEVDEAELISVRSLEIAVKSASSSASRLVVLDVLLVLLDDDDELTPGGGPGGGPIGGPPGGGPFTLALLDAVSELDEAILLS
jgi:hypothetical protein